VYQFSSKSGGNCPFHSVHLNFKHGGGGHLEAVTSGIAFFSLAGCRKPTIDFLLIEVNETHSLNFMEFRRILTGLLQFEFFHNGGYRHLGVDDR
jgi:hypothetical protein